MSTVTERVIALLRHGETTGGSGFRGRCDDPLTAHGWEQMTAAVDHHSDWEAIVSSPLSRCAAFARKFSEAANIPLRRDARLQELDFGRWDGRSAAEIMNTEADALAAFWNDPYRNPPPGGEDLEIFEQRVLGAWHDLIAQQQRRVLLITHAGVIRMLLCHLHSAPRSRLLQFDVPHASLHRAVMGQDGAWRVAASPAKS